MVQSPLTLTVVGALQMTLQQYFSSSSCPFFDVVFPSLLLTYPPFWSFHYPQQNCLWHEMWPYHLSFRHFTMVRRSSCTPVAFWILLRTSSFVIWSLWEMFRSLRKHSISMAWILLSCIPDKVFRDVHPFWRSSYTRRCKTTSCMASGCRCWYFDVIFTSFCAKRFNVNFLDRSRTEHILLGNIVIPAWNW